jgi:hypothetical protein
MTDESTMIKCLICEKDILCEKLILHSAKCKDAHEFKEELNNLISIIETHGENAEKMKNSLETHAVKHQKSLFSLLSAFPYLLLGFIGNNSVPEPFLTHPFVSNHQMTSDKPELLL